MKTTYVERIEHKHAFFSSMRCSKCNSRDYEIVEQLKPECESHWFIRCSKCGAEVPPSFSREVAITRWKQL